MYFISNIEWSATPIGHAKRAFLGGVQVPKNTVVFGMLLELFDGQWTRPGINVSTLRLFAVSVMLTNIMRNDFNFTPN